MPNDQTANWHDLCSKSEGLSVNVRLPFPPSFHSSSGGSAREQAIPSSSCPSTCLPLSAVRAPVQTALWTNAAKHSLICLSSLTTSPPCRPLRHHRPPGRTTTRSTRSQPLPHRRHHGRRTVAVGRPLVVRPCFASPHFFRTPMLMDGCESEVISEAGARRFRVRCC